MQATNSHRGLNNGLFGAVAQTSVPIGFKTVAQFGAEFNLPALRNCQAEKVEILAFGRLGVQDAGNR